MSWKEIPGPPTLPIIGQMHNFFPGGQLHNMGQEMYRWLYKKYGPIVRIETALAPKHLILYDPEGIEEVLRGENWVANRPVLQSLAYFRKHHNRTEEESRRTAGIILEQGEEWKDLRSKINPIMMMPKTVKLYSNAIDEVAIDMVKRLKAVRDGNNMISENFCKEINLWSLESIAVIALGTRLNCLDPNSSLDENATKLISSSRQLFQIAYMLDIRPGIWRYYATPMFKKAMSVYADIESATKYYISSALEKLKADGKQDESEKGVLEKLLAIDEHVATVMATDLLFGGIDTTSNTMLALLYAIAKHPEKQRKLREEINADKERRPYLKACIKESMRVLPVIENNYRVTTKEYAIMGYKIPKNMGIMCGQHVICMMDSVFPKAKEFIPERWLVGKDDPLYYGNAHSFAHLPFGFGTRSCIGNVFF